MRSFFARLFVTALGFWIADQLLSGVWFDSVGSLLFAALLLGVANAIIRPVLFWLTLPITILTLGLFVFVLNGAMVLLVSRFLPSFHIDGLGTAVLASIVVGITGWIANGFIGKDKNGTTTTSR